MPRPTDIARKERADARIEEYKRLLLENDLQERLAAQAMKPPVTMQAVRYWRKTRKDFDEWYQFQHGILTEMMVVEAHRRAFDKTRNTSDRVLLEILKKRHDSPYCDRQGGTGTFFVKVERALTPIPEQLPEGTVDGEYSEAP